MLKQTILACLLLSPRLLAAQIPADVVRIDRPLSVEKLVSGSFVAYSLKWQATVPGGDPVEFTPDGRVLNRRAGLAGHWRVENDSTLLITQEVGNLAGPAQRFLLRADSGDMVNPLPAPGGSGHAMTWILEKVVKHDSAGSTSSH